MYDKVERPEHYTQGEMEAWDAIVALGCGYLDGNVVKYIARFRYKGDPLGDLHKARAYIDKLIQETQAGIRDNAEHERQVTEVAEPYVEPSTSHPFWPYDVRTSTGRSVAGGSDHDQQARLEQLRAKQEGD